MTSHSSHSVRIPKLRFPGFSEEWEVKKLDTVAKIGTGNKDTKDRIDNGEYPFYVRSDTVERIDSYSYDGVAILTSGDGVGVGKNFHFVDGKFDYHQRVYAIRNFTEDVIPRYIYEYFAEKFYPRVVRMSAKNSVDSVRMDMIAKMQILFPSKKEQEKIARFLTVVDERIATMDKKVELLQQYKKGVMQKIFTQKLRFKDENGNDYPAWQTKKLGAIFDGLKGSGLSLGDISEEGENKCILYGELYTKYPEKVGTVLSRTNENAGTVSKRNDLLLPCSTTTTGIDLANATALDEEGVHLGGDISILRFKTKGSNVFYAYYLSHFMKNRLAAYGQGSTIIHMYYSHYKNMLIVEPSLGEQQKIADFLTSLDDKIDLEKTKLDQAKLFKKSLLQRMFV